MYNIFGVPRAITLNSGGEMYDHMYVHDQDSYGAKWLKNYMERRDKIAVDYLGPNIFMRQSISRGITESGAIFKHKQIKGHIYSRYVNVVGGKLQESSPQWHNITDYSDVFIGKDKIYNNRGSEIWR